MTIAAILRNKGHEVVSAAPDDPVVQVVAMLGERRIGAVPVVGDGQVLGVFSERDLVALLREGDPSGLSRRVGEVMTAPAVTVKPEDAVLAALSLMTRRRVRHLPVLDEGRLVGVVSIGDLVKYRIDKIEAEAEAMRAYIQQA